MFVVIHLLCICVLDSQSVWFCLILRQWWRLWRVLSWNWPTALFHFWEVCFSSTMNALWIRNWQPLLHLRRAYAVCTLVRWQHFLEWNDVMLPSWKYDAVALCQSMPIFYQNRSAKFCPDLIWKGGWSLPYATFEEVVPKRKRSRIRRTTSWSKKYYCEKYV